MTGPAETLGLFDRLPWLAQVEVAAVLLVAAGFVFIAFLAFCQLMSAGYFWCQQNLGTPKPDNVIPLRREWTVDDTRSRRVYDAIITQREGRR